MKINIQNDLDSRERISAIDQLNLAQINEPEVINIIKKDYGTTTEDKGNKSNGPSENQKPKTGGRKAKGDV